MNVFNFSSSSGSSATLTVILFRGLLTAGVLLSALLTARGAGVVSHPSEVELRAALTGGGNVTFSFNGTILLTSPLLISNDTMVDATGFGVVLSGGNTNRLMEISPGVTCILKNLVLANGRDTGTNGPAIGGPFVAPLPGEDAWAGAIANRGTLRLMGCTLTNNAAIGGNGGFYVRIDGLVYPGGHAQAGAIWNSGVLSLTNCEVVNNRASAGTSAANGSYSYAAVSGAQGGAIANLGGSVEIEGCYFTNNLAMGGKSRDEEVNYFRQYASRGTAEGGAIYSTNGTLGVWNSVFCGNALNGSSAKGGALFMSGTTNLSSSLVLSNAVFVGNQATNYVPYKGSLRTPAQGGAICAVGVTEVLVLHSLIASNVVDKGHGSHGGGVYCEGGNVVVWNSTFAGNVSKGSGYGPYIAPGDGIGGGLFASRALITNCTFVGNHAAGGFGYIGDGDPYLHPVGGDGEGGGVSGGDIHLTQCTVAGNVAERGSGVVREYFSYLGNARGGGVYVSGSGSLRGTLLGNNQPYNAGAASLLADAGYNLSTDSTTNCVLHLTNYPAVFTASTSRTNTNPQLGPLGDYGGLTPTMPLLAGSPAIDAGGDGAGVATDQRGRSRPFGNACDIGAFESSPPYVIGGQVTQSPPLGGILLTAGSASARSGSDGRYLIHGLPTGAISVAPEQGAEWLVPTNHWVSVGPDRLDVNFRMATWDRLDLVEVTETGARVFYASRTGGVFGVQASANLVDWTAIATNAIGPSNAFEILDAGASMRFYRLFQP